jgi:hypothetical protein
VVLSDGARAGSQGGAAAPGHAPRVASVSVPPPGRVPFGDSDDLSTPVKPAAPVRRDALYRVCTACSLTR